MNILLLPEIINTLSNQDFVGLDKIELWASLRTIKEMRVKMNKINKSNRNKNSMSSPFSPVMANLAARQQCWGKYTLTHWIKETKSLNSKLYRESSKKISCLYETVSLLNQCIGKKTQG